VQRCEQMDEIWVPTAFHRDTFAAAGVPAEKLVVVGEPVDTGFFDPDKHTPLAMPTGGDGPWALEHVGEELVYYAVEDGVQAAAVSPTGAVGEARAAGVAAGAAAGEAAAGGGRPFRFLSVFKWEQRKGWDALLRAFLAEFAADEPVELVRPLGGSNAPE
jgi:glycosyltransferase involved in cell wall biosynthesis